MASAGRAACGAAGGAACGGGLLEEGCRLKLASSPACTGAPEGCAPGEEDSAAAAAGDTGGGAVARGRKAGGASEEAGGGVQGCG